MNFKEVRDYSFVGFDTPRYEDILLRKNDGEWYERFDGLFAAMRQKAEPEGEFVVKTTYGGQDRWRVRFNPETKAVEVSERVGMEDQAHLLFALTRDGEEVRVTYQNHDRAKGHHWDKLLGDWEIKMVEVNSPEMG